VYNHNNYQHHCRRRDSNSMNSLVYWARR